MLELNYHELHFWGLKNMLSIAPGSVRKVRQGGYGCGHHLHHLHHCTALLVDLLGASVEEQLPAAGAQE